MNLSNLTFFMGMAALSACGGRVQEDGRADNRGGAGTAAGGAIGTLDVSGGHSGNEGSSDVAWAGASSIAATGGSRACGALIDDMEDDSGRICPGEGRTGAWYQFNDGKGVQQSSPTDAGPVVAREMLPTPRDGSRFAMHSAGHDFWVWGAGLGVDLNYDGTTYGAYDAGRFGGISFWGRSALRTTIEVRISTTITTSVAYGGTCTLEIEPEPQSCGPHFVTLSLTEDWKQYQVRFGELMSSAYITNYGFAMCPTQFEPTRLTNIQFLANHDSEFDVWIDDVYFLTDDAIPAFEPGNCTMSPPEGCEGTINFEDASLEAAIRGEIGVASRPLTWPDVCRLKYVCASYSGVSHLGGLECLPALSILGLDGDPIDCASAAPLLTSLKGQVTYSSPVCSFPRQ